MEDQIGSGRIHWLLPQLLSLSSHLSLLAGA